MGFIDRRPGGGHDLNHYVSYKRIDGNWLLFNDKTVKYQKSIGSFHGIHLAFYQKLSTTHQCGIGLENLVERQSQTSKKAKGKFSLHNYKDIWYSVKYENDFIIND